MGKFVLLVGVVWLLVGGSAEAERIDHCSDWNPHGDNCHVTVRLTSEPKSLVIFGPNAGHHFATRWVVSGREFLTGIQNECDGDYTGFGRLGPARVMETTCGGGLRIRARSVGEPIRVRFEFGAV